MESLRIKKKKIKKKAWELLDYSKKQRCLGKSDD